MRFFAFIIVFGIVFFGILALFPTLNVKGMDVSDTVQQSLPANVPYASFAGGCFWCLESEFRRLDGVLYTRAGYEGGHVENPTYEQVTGGDTGHAETTEIYYDPDKISYRDLLNHFLRRAHDPTTPNRQGVDVGPQYRSAIFYHDEEQKKLAQEVIAEIDAEKVWSKPIATALEPHTIFWAAEEYHQQYYEKYQQNNRTPHIRALYKMRKWAKEK